ncbi:hypothetical protein CLOM_g8913 [Closterium sp. NIES-68]|nr:hypothetical protein CLOM_g8913 [Closterium sp. NIES-68]
MYRLQKGRDYVLLIVYVDDLLYIGSTIDIATWFEGELKEDLTLTDEIAKGRLQLSYCPTTEMAADYLTKKLAKAKFDFCMLLTGQTNVTGSEHSSTPETKGSVGNISRT